MSSDSSNTERCIRVEFLPRERRSWCAGATRPEADLPGRGATGWTTFFRMPEALRKRLKKAESAPPFLRDAVDSTPAALPAPANGPHRVVAREPATDASMPREAREPS